MGIEDVDTTPVTGQDVPIRSDLEPVRDVPGSEVERALVGHGGTVGADVEGVDGSATCVSIVPAASFDLSLEAVMDLPVTSGVERGSGVPVLGIDGSAYGAWRLRVGKIFSLYSISQEIGVLDRPVSLMYTTE